MDLNLEWIFKIRPSIPDGHNLITPSDFNKTLKIKLIYFNSCYSRKEVFDMHSIGRIIYAFMCVKYIIYLSTLSSEDEPWGSKHAEGVN